MNDPAKPQDPQHPAPPTQTPVDAGSHALAEALRSSFAIVRLVMVLLVAAFLASGFFTVEQQERAIKLRFGKPVGDGAQALLGPGLHWAWPYPFEEYVKVPITELQQVQSTAGWFATTAVQQAAGTDAQSLPLETPLNPAIDGYALTADGNIIHTRARLLYRIDDPIRYIFAFVSASNSVRDALDNALLATAARFDVDQILTSEKAAYQEAVKRRAAELLEQQKLGVVVQECIVESIPPRQLRTDFDNVIRAGILRAKSVDEARSYENQALSKARADAEVRVNLAESERVRLVTDLAGQAERFADILPKYQANAKLFMEQRLAETMARGLTNVQDKIFMSERADGKPRELRLLLNREPRKLDTQGEATTP